MPTTNNDEDFIAIKCPDIVVDMNEAASSNSTIGTTSLGPCVGLIIDCLYEGKPVCILDHYSFLETDESTMSSLTRLVWFLKYLLNLFKIHLFSNSTTDISDHSKIADIFLLVTGGDPEEGFYIRELCYVIYGNRIDLTNEKFCSKEILYLYHVLKERIVVTLPMTKNLSDDEEEEAATTGYGLDHVSLWLNYCCKTKLVSMGIHWSSQSGHLDIALANFNLFSKSKSEILWKHRSKGIENFKKLCRLDELKYLGKSLEMIPDKVFDLHRMNPGKQ